MTLRLVIQRYMNFLQGPVGMLVGFEYRKESYNDDRDPLLDGTIRLSGASTNKHLSF